jgi:hypothetical protein
MAPKQANVTALIADHNQAPPFGLPQIEIPRRMGCMTPLEVWNDAGHRWTLGVDSTSTVDGVSILFSYIFHRFSWAKETSSNGPAQRFVTNEPKTISVFH